MVTAFFILFFIAVAVASLLGAGVDSRDPSFSLFSRRDDVRVPPRS